MSLPRSYLHAPRAVHPQSRLPSTSVSFSRSIRIKSAVDGDDRPPEGHVLERKDTAKNTLDPQAQSAQGSTHAPRDERPAYVHGRVNKGDPTGGTSMEGKTDAAAPSLLGRMKQMLGLGKSESKHGAQSGNK